MHAAQEETFYVISSELAIEVEGVLLSVLPRGFVLVPRGTRRRHVATPGTRVLAIYSPGHAVPRHPSEKSS